MERVLIDLEIDSGHPEVDRGQGTDSWNGLGGGGANRDQYDEGQL